MIKAVVACSWTAEQRQQTDPQRTCGTAHDHDLSVTGLEECGARFSTCVGGPILIFRAANWSIFDTASISACIDNENFRLQNPTTSADRPSAPQRISFAKSTNCRAGCGGDFHPGPLPCVAV